MLWIALSWTAFYGLHSLLLLDGVRLRIMGAFSLERRQYRLAYNVISAITLLIAFWVTWKVPSTPLFDQNGFIRVIGLFGMLSGAWLAKRAFRSYSFPEFMGLHEETQMPLNIQGMNRYMRHPLYTASLMVFWSAVLFFATMTMLLIALITTVYVQVGYRLEEKRMVRHFGKTYEEYQKQVPPLFPRWR